MTKARGVRLVDLTSELFAGTAEFQTKSNVLHCWRMRFLQKRPMLSQVCSAAVNGTHAFAVEVEVNCGYGESFVAIVATDSQ